MGSDPSLARPRAARPAGGVVRDRPAVPLEARLGSRVRPAHRRSRRDARATGAGRPGRPRPHLAAQARAVRHRARAAVAGHHRGRPRAPRCADRPAPPAADCRRGTDPGARRDRPLAARGGLRRGPRGGGGRRRGAAPVRGGGPWSRSGAPMRGWPSTGPTPTASTAGIACTICSGRGTVGSIARSRWSAWRGSGRWSARAWCCSCEPSGDGARLRPRPGRDRPCLQSRGAVWWAEPR